MDIVALAGSRDHNRHAAAGALTLRFSTAMGFDALRRAPPRLRVDLPLLAAP